VALRRVGDEQDVRPRICRLGLRRRHAALRFSSGCVV
jgi:hypothetical protein